MIFLYQYDAPRIRWPASSRTGETGSTDEISDRLDTHR
jgi:hypothetical protein